MNEWIGKKRLNWLQFGHFKLDQHQNLKDSSFFAEQ